MQYPTVDRVMDPMELTARLAKMSTDQLRTYAQMHSDDANVVALALAESKRRQVMKPQPQMQQQPTVLEQTLGQMGQQAESEELPEDVGIGQLPVRNMPEMAEGGIVAFARGGNSGEGQSDPVDVAIQAEGVTDPRQIAFIKAIYGQESGSGQNTKTSNRGAVGHMQVTPIAFKDVNRGDLDPSNKYDMARAGVRYALKSFQAAGGDPALAGVHYYSGPDGLKDAMRGKARVDRENPKAPDSLKYGQQIAERFASLAAPAAAAPAAPSTPQESSAFVGDIKSLWDKITGTDAEKKAYLDRYHQKRAEAAAENEAIKQYFTGTQSDYNLARGRANQTMYPSRGSHALFDKSVAEQPEAPASAPATPGMHPTSGYDPTEAWDDLNARPEATAPAPAAAAAPEEKTWFDRMSGDDWMTLGLGLLKSRSPYWQESLGTAGEAMMAGKRAAEKAALEKKKAEDEADYRNKYIGVLGQKDETAGQRFALDALSKAAKAAQDEIDTKSKTAEGIMALKDPAKWAQITAAVEAKHMQQAQRHIKAITGKEYDFSELMGNGPARADFTLNPGKGLVRN